MAKNWVGHKRKLLVDWTYGKCVPNMNLKMFWSRRRDAGKGPSKMSLL